MATDTQESSADIIAEMRNLGKLDEKSTDKIPRALMGLGLRTYADRLEAAHRLEVDKLNSAIQATVSRSDAEIDRLRREIAELRQAGDAAKLPDGRKMYDKYQIRHTDGTPLKGKRYFVLRLDSDDPLEAARVAAAMSAYKGETPQGNAAKLREAAEKTRTTLEEALQILNGISDEEAGRLNARLEDVADAICEVTQWIIPDALATPATTEKSSAVGDCAKMREALSKFCAYSAVVLNTGMFNRVHLEALLNMAKAALATPPRQCDIGTDNEQIRRWKEFCDHYEVDRSPESFARWGQGPYFDSISEGEEEPETNTQAKEGGDK